MGKGKRNREAKQRITIGRGEFKAYMMNVVNNCDDASFQALADLFLMACGVIDQDGNLTESYENSPYWTVEGGKIQPSEHAKLLQQLSPKVLKTIEEMGNSDEID